MKMMYPQLLSVLPPGLREVVAVLPQDVLEELRLRPGRRLRAVTGGRIAELEARVKEDDLRYCVNTASRYSPWNAASMARGYLTAPGGHRIGLCGVYREGKLQVLTSLCIRVAKDFPGISRGISTEKSLLILGPPGCGKTTLLRDLIRRISQETAISVVDEREELFPGGGGERCFDPGPNTDVLLGCGKAAGIDMVLRSMGPRWIATDEITEESDCAALIRSLRCGVQVVATAHAACAADLLKREVYAPLAHSGVFHDCVVLDRNRQWHMEEICR